MEEIVIEARSALLGPLEVRPARQRLTGAGGRRRWAGLLVLLGVVAPWPAWCWPTTR
ncbi:hypothetical protein ABZ714_29200 [Streptomyces sp. NPDC006798]|uniref:hypothetical protein n=1 Tax=Streptomyces sp. NPDC006798 TaxID=3155462 RepID=UPI00340E3D4E